MKRTIFTAILATLAIQQANAQAVLDTVSMGAGYANNVWYSLDNDNQAEVSATNWDLGLAATINPSSPLVASIIFNLKSGNVYEIGGATIANFATADTTGLSTWTPLDNDETNWANGALNTMADGHPDYGWGIYDGVSHSGIAADRVFVIKYTDNTCVKFYVDLAFLPIAKYTVTFANLDNTGQGTQTMLLADYAGRNFGYVKLGAAPALVSREPSSASWDLLFTQYKTTAVPAPFNTVTGILHNVGVESAKVIDVDNTATYEDWQSATFAEEINTIGYNWKAFENNIYTMAPNTVYFVKDQTGDIWKIIFTGFTGASEGKTMFSKEKLETLGLSEGEAAVFTAAFPNPANTSFSMAVSNGENAEIRVYNLLGALCYETAVSGNQLQEVQIPVADLNNGLYQVVCTSNGKSVAQKIVVQH